MRDLDLLVRRAMRFLPLVVIVICATLAARAAGDVFVARSEKPAEGERFLREAAHPPRATSVDDARAAAAAADAKKDADAVTSRSLTCADCAAESPPPPVDTPAAATRPPFTSLPIVLVAISRSGDGRIAAATVADARSTWSGAYTAGDLIPGAGRVVTVGSRYVDFENRAAGRVERLDLLGAPPPVSASLRSPADGGARADSPQTPAQAFAAELDRGVKATDATHYTISRDVVDHFLADPNLLAGAVRVRPGQGGGLALSGVRPGSAPAKLGLANGDQVMSINGYEIGANLDKLLELYDKLKSAKSISMELERGGQTLTMQYAIR
jgi:type II secretory pathway component PulC